VSARSSPTFQSSCFTQTASFTFLPACAPLTFETGGYNAFTTAAPTASGLQIGTVPKTGAGQGLPVLANNIIPFDLAKNTASLVNWGNSTNSKLLTALTLSNTRQNTVPMSPIVTLGSIKITDVIEPGGSIVYTVYVDPNGLTINVPATPGLVVYKDVNSNPIQYYDGQIYHTLQADYSPSVDGTITYYIQPPSTYDQTIFSLTGDDDLYGSPGDQWRYYLSPA
jgi:hypothetical protein